MTDHRHAKLAALAAALADANPHAAEQLAHLLARAARRTKAPVGFGIAVYADRDGRVEVRGGDLDAYVDGRPPGDGYEES